MFPLRQWGQGSSGFKVSGSTGTRDAPGKWPDPFHRAPLKNDATHGMGPAQGDGFAPELFRDGSGAWACAAPASRRFRTSARSDYGLGRAWRSMGTSSSIACHGEPTRSVGIGAVTHACRKDTDLFGFRSWTRTPVPPSVPFPCGRRASFPLKSLPLRWSLRRF